MNWEYLIVLGATVFFPLVLSRNKNLSIWKNKSSLFKTMLFVCVPFLIWDIVVTARGHWWFNPNYVVGISFCGLPIEEWLFFVVIAFVSVFVWESTKYFVRTK